MTLTFLIVHLLILRRFLNITTLLEQFLSLFPLEEPEAFNICSLFTQHKVLGRSIQLSQK